MYEKQENNTLEKFRNPDPLRCKKATGYRDKYCGITEFK
jgi:hypothetical protein